MGRKNSTRGKVKNLTDFSHLISKNDEIEITSEIKIEDKKQE